MNCAVNYKGTRSGGAVNAVAPSGPYVSHNFVVDFVQYLWVKKPNGQWELVNQAVLDPLRG